MSEQKENTSISYQKDFAQRHVQTNNVGYIYLFLDLLIFFCTNSNRQLNHKYFRIQGLGLYCWNEGSTGKIPELNLSSCFRIVCSLQFQTPQQQNSLKDTASSLQSVSAMSCPHCSTEFPSCEPCYSAETLCRHAANSEF